MAIQHYPDELDYVNAILHPLAPKVGSFMMAFCQACIAADDENYEFIRPALITLMEKYPADVQRLAMEHLDRGVENEQPKEGNTKEVGKEEEQTPSEEEHNNSKAD